MICSLALGLSASAAAASIEVEPSLVHSDPISSLEHPAYGRADTEAALDDTAATDGEELTQRASEDAGDDADVDDGERDCAKTALGDLGWDIWWAIAYDQSFNLESAAEQVLAECLNAELADQVDVAAVAHDFAAMISSDTEAVYQQEEGDIYGVADWLLYTDYWHVEQ